MGARLYQHGAKAQGEATVRIAMAFSKANQERAKMATQPPPEAPTPTPQPAEPTAPPPEITPPTPDVDVPSPGTPGTDPGTQTPAEI